MKIVKLGEDPEENRQLNRFQEFRDGLRYMSTTIMDFMQNDHIRLHKLLEESGRLRKARPAEAKRLLGQFRSGIERHIEWEEKILFPFFEQKSGITNGPTQVMRSEHTRIKELLRALSELPFDTTGHPDSLSQMSGLKMEAELWELLKDHNLKEEHILYPALDELSEESERKRMLDSMSK